MVLKTSTRHAGSQSREITILVDLGRIPIVLSIPFDNVTTTVKAINYIPNGGAHLKGLQLGPLSTCHAAVKHLH